MKDGEHMQLSKKYAVDVCERCHKNYGNEGMIANHLEKVEQYREKIKNCSYEPPFTLKLISVGNTSP